MIVTKYLCDRCEKEMRINEVYKVEVKEGLGIAGDYSSFHLCENCVKILLKWIKNHE